MTRRPGLTGIAARIVAGTLECPAEVWVHNVHVLLLTHEHISSGAAEHAPKSCKNKDCVDHGDRTRTPLAHAALLANEVPDVCTCGKHTGRNM